MSNMPYCRWQNTAPDLLDCLDNFHDIDNDLSSNGILERAARLRIVVLAAGILEEIGLEVDRIQLMKAMEKMQ